MNMKRVLLLLLVLGSMSLSAQDSQKQFRHHEFSSSFSVGSNPADKAVQDVTSQYIDAYQMEVANGCFNIFGAKESEYADYSTSIDKMAVSYNQVKWKATYQITAVGFDAGLGSFHVYDELGYGCQGVWVVCGCRVVF